MADLAFDLAGVRLGNPVLPASGTFGIGHARVFDPDRLGAIVPKTVTLRPRRGHPPPRLGETAHGLINAIGIPSMGVEEFLARQWPAYERLAPPKILSISADTAEEFAELAARVDDCGASALELNLSCPNLEAGGKPFAVDPAESRRVTAACRAVSRLPLWCKLSPAAADAPAVARATADAGADALIVANTMPALALSPSGAPLLANRTGGLSGAPLKPINLRLTDEIARTVPLPIIGCGGVTGLQDALDYFAAGASAVAVGTATLARPSAMIELIEALAAYVGATGRKPWRTEATFEGSLARRVGA